MAFSGISGVVVSARPAASKATALKRRSVTKIAAKPKKGAPAPEPRERQLRANG
jgi:hypothetical protein